MWHEFGAHERPFNDERLSYLLLVHVFDTQHKLSLSNHKLQENLGLDVDVTQPGQYLPSESLVLYFPAADQYIKVGVDFNALTARESEAAILKV